MVTYSVKHVCRESAEKIESAAQVDRMRVKDLKVRRLQDVVGVPILGYAGLYENEKAIGGTNFNRQLAVQEHFSTKDLNAIQEIVEPVFFLGKYNVCWGHCITDGLKFLWPFLRLDKYPALRDYKIVYTTIGRDDELPKNFRELLRIFGIDDDRLVRLRQVTKLHDCYLADECFGAERLERWFTPEYREVIRYICQKCTDDRYATPSSSKIYLSRRAWQSGWVSGEFGEQYLERAFRNVGFEVVHPEQIPFREFVWKLQYAKTVAATECSSSHNAVFLPKDTTVVLLRKLDRVNFYQLAINQAAELSAVYVDVGRPIVYAAPKLVQRGPFFLYVTKYLAEYLGTKPHFPAGTYLQCLMCACWSKCYGIFYDFAYHTYKLVVVRWFGVTRWEKSRLT